MFGNVPADSRKSNVASSAALVSGNITSTKATSTLQNWSVPGYTFHSVIGYVPKNFLTNQKFLPDFVYFNAVPDQDSQPIPSVSDPNILLLPIGASICGIYLTNNGVEFTTSGVFNGFAKPQAPAPEGITVGIAAINITSPVINNNNQRGLRKMAVKPNVFKSLSDPLIGFGLLGNITLSQLNAVGGLGKGISGSPLDINIAIDAPNFVVAAPAPALLSSTFGIAFGIEQETPGTTLLTGSLGVIISYILPGPSFGTVTPL
jgi:hypothetical protein